MIRPELSSFFTLSPLVDERLIEEAWMRSHIASLVWANRCMPQSTARKRRNLEEARKHGKGKLNKGLHIGV